MEVKITTFGSNIFDIACYGELPEDVYDMDDAIWEGYKDYVDLKERWEMRYTDWKSNREVKSDIKRSIER